MTVVDQVRKRTTITQWMIAAGVNVSLVASKMLINARTAGTC